jgi:DNA polymerase V
MRDYSNEEGELIVKEMTELLCHEMTDEGMLTRNVSIGVGYSNAMKVPMTHGSVSFSILTNASSVIIPAVADLYRKIAIPDYPVRRIFVNFNDIKPKSEERQMTLFDLADMEAEEEGKTAGQQRKEGFEDPIAETQARLKRDAALQEAVNSIRKKYGKNAMFRGMDLEEAATTLERNHQIGGHRE